MKLSDALKPLSDLENRLGLPKGFYHKLLKEDDWSFVVKTHALIEAAVTHLLSKTTAISFRQFDDLNLDEELLAQAFSRLELSDKRKGKVSFSKALGLLMDYQRSFIHSLSEIRNAFVHDVRNVNLTVSKYFQSLGPEKQHQFILSFEIGISDDLLTSFGETAQRDAIVRENPKLSIWLSGLVCLKEIYYCIEFFGNSEKLIKMTAEMAEFSKLLAPIVNALISKKNSIAS